MNRRILLVTQDAFVAAALIRSLERQGCTVALRDTFKTAAVELTGANLDLVIADVKLAPFNGIHLAIRARAQEIETIVFGPDDPVLRRDAAAAGARYVNTPLAETMLESGLLSRTRSEHPGANPSDDSAPALPMRHTIEDDRFSTTYPAGKKRVVIH